jgi:transposase-like protein
MALVMCPLCTSDEVDVVANLPDGRKRVYCGNCDRTWEHGEPREERRPQVMTAVEARGRFPKAGDVTPEARQRAERLKERFLSEVRREPDPRVAVFWKKYQQVFSAEGLPTCDPGDLKDFANAHAGVYVGFMTGFNNAWNELGPKQAAEQTRQVIDYLLRGPDPSLENRLDDLISGKLEFSIPGFKEALLSKVLSVVYPDRFLTIVTYEQKAVMAKFVYGLELPAVDRVSWTRGRLIVWSNDLLNELTGDGFADRPHAGDFLWWAKDQR